MFEDGDVEEQQQSLRALIYDRIIFTSTWAAPPGESGTVPYEYDPVFLDEFLNDRIPDWQEGLVEDDGHEQRDRNRLRRKLTV
jgi:hypothetical protein